MTRAPYYDDGDVTLHHGHALDVAKALPSGLARTIVTSPPYFGLRDYGHDDQLGAEPTLADYVANLVALFRELRRVLTDDGTLWLNLGDSYGGNTAIGRNDAGRNFTGGGGNRAGSGNPGQQGTRPAVGQSKNLLGVPWRVAFALQADGWILRSDIIWAKPNPMPESVTDRPTKAHEYVFLFAKSPRYYYDADAIAEADSGPTGGRQRAAMRGDNRYAGGTKVAADRRDAATLQMAAVTGKRNKRSVWEIPTAPFPGAHFAVYPPELIRPCILAGSDPGDTVLDPFSGSGTTGMVAGFEGRRYVGIDVNSDYLDMSIRTRFAQPTLGIEAV